ncbi:zinc-ribbon domain-containing protein [Faecalibacterium duncaniae]
MKYCGKCGAKLEEDFLYCPVCGENFKKSDSTSEPSKDILQTAVNAIRGNEFWMIDGIIFAAIFLEKWLDRVWILAVEAVCAVLNMVATQ